MKKILAMVICVAMILSLGVVLASADEYLPAGISGTPGKYAGEGAGGSVDTFAPVGNIAVQWVADAAEKIEFDGNMEEWMNYDQHDIGLNNLVTWVDNGLANGGTTSSAPANFGITSYFLADADYLYVGFFITDDNVQIGKEANKYNTDGDAFQLAVDFGGALARLIENDFAAYDKLPSQSKQMVFYSFDLDNADGAELNICLQNHSQTATEFLNESNSDGKVKGYGKATEQGWCAEFALSWEMMYEHYLYKTDYRDTNPIYIGGDDNQALEVGIGLYYLNNQDGNGISWAAGTASGILVSEANPAPAVTWSPIDCAIELQLSYNDGMEINCSGIEILGAGETEPPLATLAPNEDVTDPEEDGDNTTAAPENDTTAAPEADTTAAPSDETKAPAEGDGCASVMGLGAVAILAAAAAAVALKKKD